MLLLRPDENCVGENTKGRSSVTCASVRKNNVEECITSMNLSLIISLVGVSTSGNTTRITPCSNGRHSQVCSVTLERVNLLYSNVTQVVPIDPTRISLKKTLPSNSLQFLAISHITWWYLWRTTVLGRKANIISENLLCEMSGSSGCPITMSNPVSTQYFSQNYQLHFLPFR